MKAGPFLLRKGFCNIYARIKKANSSGELQLLRPLLAYTSARQKGEGGKVIIALLDDSIICSSGSS